MNCNAHIRFAVVLLLCTIGSFTGLVAAQEKANTNEGEKGTVDQDMAYMTVSGELARLAADSSDAFLMLAAARLEAMVAVKATSRDKTSEGDTVEAKLEPKPEKKDLYALAKQFAGTNKALHDLIEYGRLGEATRRRVGSPALSHDRVGAYRTDVYSITFRGGEFAEVSVRGDGDTDLDLYIYDQYGNQICSDIDSTDQTYCGWTPAWTGTFRIKIENLGSVYNEYRIATN